MNVLVVAPHPDDEVIGCGGTLCQYAKEGARITVVFLTSGELGLKHLPVPKAQTLREREANQAAKLLGVRGLHFLRAPDWFVGSATGKLATRLGKILELEMPQLIFVPHQGEWHPDHKAALPLLAAALTKSRAPIPEIRTYEVWTPLTEFDHVINITSIMPRKLRALRAHKSQLKEFNYERAIRGLNAFRGELQAKCRYAEVFQTVRLVHTRRKA
jgi:LmbE family N-acetylglucosaminyl deacetylase